METTSKPPELVCGLDLAAKPKNPSALAFIEKKTLNVKLLTLHGDEEIVQAITSVKPVITAIDAPLSLPKSGGAYRKAELLLRHVYGCKTLPLTLSSMKKLYERGVKIASLLGKAGLKVIEVHPSSTRKILGWKGLTLDELKAKLVETGLKGDVKRRKISKDEVDAILAAVTALYYLARKATAVGDPKEGVIVIPNP